MDKEALLYEKIESGKTRCLLCPHACVIAGGESGICGVRYNKKGVLYTSSYGKIISGNVDPIEKKPLYHFLPGSNSYSIAARGCNLKCDFCQNWEISQMENGYPGLSETYSDPREVVSDALRCGAETIAYTYTEPTVFFEFALDTAKIAKNHNLRNIFVSNGYISEKALDIINPFLDAVNIDLKSFNDDFYKKKCGGLPEPVKNSIKYLKKSGVWIEVTTLIIPGENDDISEIENIAAFIVDVDSNIPWHISRFHPAYKFTKSSVTPLDTMIKAKYIGEKCGLKHVYLGNASQGQDTYCEKCGMILISRDYYNTKIKNFKNGTCISCGNKIMGVWS